MIYTRKKENLVNVKKTISHRQVKTIYKKASRGHDTVSHTVRNLTPYSKPQKLKVNKSMETNVSNNLNFI